MCQGGGKSVSLVITRKRIKKTLGKETEQSAQQKNKQQAEAPGRFLEESASLCVGSLLGVLP